MNLLSSQPQSVDFQHYRSTLGNAAIVDEIEGHFKAFKPATYDVGRQIKAIEAFEVQAVKSAQETKGRVDSELRDLEKTLENIETARPFEDLTVVSIELENFRLILAMLMFVCACRTMLRRHARRSTLARKSLCRRGVGRSQATKYVILEFLNGSVDGFGASH